MHAKRQGAGVSVIPDVLQGRVLKSARSTEQGAPANAVGRYEFIVEIPGVRMSGARVAELCVRAHR